MNERIVFDLFVVLLFYLINLFKLKKNPKIEIELTKNKKKFI